MLKLYFFLIKDTTNISLKKLKRMFSNVGMNINLQN